MLRIIVAISCRCFLSQGVSGRNRRGWWEIKNWNETETRESEQIKLSYKSTVFVVSVYRGWGWWGWWIMGEEMLWERNVVDGGIRYLFTGGRGRRACTRTNAAASRSERAFSVPARSALVSTLRSNPSQSCMLYVETSDVGSSRLLTRLVIFLSL